MKAKRLLQTFLIVAVLGSNIGCDQVSKRMVRQRIGYHEEIGLLSNYVTLTRVENKGAFLSLGDSLPDPIRFTLLTILPVLVLGGVLLFVLTKSNLSRATVLGICFIGGGGIGNVYDRFVYGSVTDFLHIDFVIFQTGIFNMADVSIMTGVVIVLVETYFKRAEFKTDDTNQLMQN